MNKNFVFLAAAFLQICFSITVVAQESNLKEDYLSLLPEVRVFNKMIAQLPQTTSMLTKEGLQKSRDIMKSYETKTTILHPTTKRIKGPDGDIGLMIFKPDTIRAVVLDIHGGAWSVGEAASDAGLNDEMARTCKVAVVSVDYRLAPEYPFPACIEDCKAAAKWLVKNAEAEFGTNKIFISGASAGGHLAAVVTLYIRDSLGAINNVKGVNLVYGCFDLGRTPSNRLASDSTLLLYKKSIEETMQLVFGGWSVEQRQNPAYSPLFANLVGLPPALFTVGTADPLLDDSFFMETRWRNAGNETFLAVYPECPHGFNLFPTKIAKLANARMYAWINALCN